MDGRWKQLLAGSILCGMLGCSHFRDKSNPPMGTSEPPFAMSSNKPIVEERRAKNEGPKPETLIAVGNVRIQAAADEGRSTPEREELANQARLAYQQALSRDPKNLEAMLGMARMFAVVKDRELCAEWYQRAAKAHPTKGEIWFEMGRTFGGHFKDKETAINCLHAATKLAPENRTYRTELGFTLAWAGRYDEGYAWLSRVMPDSKARYNIAGVMEHNGQPEMARQQLALALHADPNHEPAKQMMAALTGTREKPSDSQIQTINHEQVNPLLTLPHGKALDPTPLNVRPNQSSPVVPNE